MTAKRRRRNLSKKYSIQVLDVTTPWGWGRHLVVSRRDGRDGIPWDDLQAIKDEELGSDCWAVELYPPNDQVVNQMNARHLWEIPADMAPYDMSGRRA